MKTKERIGTAAKILLGIVYMTPVILGLLFSIQPQSELMPVPQHLFTKNPTLANYINVFKSMPLFKYMKNTLITVAIVVPVQLFFASTSAFAFAFFDFKGKDLLFGIYLAAMMIPGETTVVAKFMMINGMGLLNTYLGLTIVDFVAVGGIFMLRQNMMSMPRELWEAAQIDGCTEMRYFGRVVLPLCGPLLSCQAITSFIGVYGSYLWPMMITTKEEYFTLQVGMATLRSEVTYVTSGNVLAAAVICMVIPLLVYIFLQRYVVAGLTAGAVKN